MEEFHFRFSVAEAGSPAKCACTVHSLHRAIWQMYKTMGSAMERRGLRTSLHQRQDRRDQTDIDGINKGLMDVIYMDRK